ncbi:unnamed protein product [Phytomonas sp. EM1]|nr:unnamed protein product [Phytomonas sp. EM1]|eukprot:CCW61334.1 unnamed protein product [Phytomonas sp. isolate EM1]
MNNQRKVPPEPLHTKRYPQTGGFRDAPTTIEPVHRAENTYRPGGYNQGFDPTMAPQTSNDYVAYNDPTQMPIHTRNQAMVPQHGEPHGYRPDTHASYYARCPPPSRPWQGGGHPGASQDSYPHQGANFYGEDNGLYHHDQHYAYEGTEAYPAHEWQTYDEGVPSGALMGSGTETDAYFCETGGVEVLSTTERGQDQAYYPASPSKRDAAPIGPTRGIDSILAPPATSTSSLLPLPPATHYPHSQSSSQQRKHSFRYSDSDPSLQKDQSASTMHGPKAVKTTERIPASTGAILATSGSSSYPSKRERDGNFSRRGVDSSMMRNAPAAAHSSPIFPIASGAPLLRVPTDLPVSTTSFLDLIANFVFQGGPTFEEELLFRERSNPHFDFLRAPWNDPRVLYYRWRLYSLLQGDNMLEWRTEPFQMERSGSKAYVWVPPPAIAAGPASLVKAFASPPQGGKKRAKAASPQEPSASREVDGEQGGGDTCVLPPASATWLSRQVVREGRVFVTLSEEEEKRWKDMLNVETFLPTEVVAAMKRTSDNSASSSPSASVESTSPPSPKHARMHCTPVDSTNCPGTIESIQRSLLSNDVIAERTIFAVEHAHAALHVWSILLDEVLKLAYECAWEAQKAHFSSARKASEASAAKNETADPSAKDSFGQHELPSGGDDDAIRMHVMCFQLLFYLFIVHDTIQNSNAEALTDEEAAGYSNYHADSPYHVQHSLAPGRMESNAKETDRHQEAGVGGVDGSSSSMPGSSASQPASSPFPIPSSAKLPPTSPSSSYALLQEVEGILPTLIEATLLIALTGLHYFSKRLRKYRGLEVARKHKSSSNDGDSSKEHKKGDDAHRSATRSKTLKTGLNVRPEDVDAVTTYFPHLATVLGMPTTQGGAALGNPSGSAPHAVLHEEYMRAILVIPSEVRDSIANAEPATSGEEDRGKERKGDDATSGTPGGGNDMDDAAGVVRARLLLVWLRQFLCWWMRYTPETFWCNNSDGEPASWSSPKSKADKSDEANKEQEMSVVSDTTALPTSNNVIRGRTAASLIERYGFLLNNAYL